MLVSWKWLQQYVTLEMTPDQAAQRLALSGLNHEGTTTAGDDLAIDLEVTSNRADCLGHIGVAREIAVLWDLPLQKPAPQIQAAGPPVSDLAAVSIACPDLCPRYTGRVIRGVKVGTSPSWLLNRLATVFGAAWKPVNNVVDITNYVLMECGQPLHAFDLSQIHGSQIQVRRAEKGELFEAIDHKQYQLQPAMCVIGDADRAVALGGVMGGADSEVSNSTTDLFIESAEFEPKSIRNTARSLNLHSPSSYRFERRVDPKGIDWASRRCCEMILELCGGELADGLLEAGTAPGPRTPVVLRLSQLKRILGISVDRDEVRRILLALGNHAVRDEPAEIEVVPPTWRRDLTREIDLVEEVARIHGYEQIPEDVAVPMVPSHRSDEDRLLSQARHVMTAAGFDEAMTRSVVPHDWTQQFSLWSSGEPLRCTPSLIQGADCLRPSLIPSLLQCRSFNESKGNSWIELFESARVYLPPGEHDKQTNELVSLGIVSGRDFFAVKGVVQALLRQLHVAYPLETTETKQDVFELGCELLIDGSNLGYMGIVSAAAAKSFKLRSETVAVELRLDKLLAAANLIPQQSAVSSFPGVSRDFNFIVNEKTPWQLVEQCVRSVPSELLEDVVFHEIYRDADKDGADKKRVLFSVRFRSVERTLTGEEVEGLHQQVVGSIEKRADGRLIS